MQTCDIWSYKQPSDRNLVISQLSQSSPVASLNSNFSVVSTCWMTFQWWSLSLFLGLLFVCSLSLIVWTKTMMPVVRTVINLWKIKRNQTFKRIFNMNDLTVIVLFFLLFGEWPLAFVVFLAIYSLEQEQRDKSFEE